MQYACLVYTPQAGPDATPDVYAEYMALAEDATKRGVMKGGHELADSGTATTLRVRNGKRAVTDGPFAETKEVLGGFFVFDCASLDEALTTLDKDRAFLTKGGVFSDDMIDAYIELKMEEVTRFRMTTHPVEFDMYYSL